MNGNNIFVKVGDTTIAATKSNELQTSCGTIEIANPTYPDWKSFLAGRKEWSLNVSFLVTAQKPANIGNLRDPRHPLAIGTTYTLNIVNRNDSSDTLSGTAICTQCKINSVRGSLCTGSISFKGTGALLT